VHVDSWRAAYRDHLPAELLAGLSVGRRARGWRELVAFARLGPSRDAEGDGELYAIYLDPRRLGTGVGPALMDAALERLRELGYAEATLWVLDDNERAERFYVRAGWRREEATKVDHFGGTPVREVRYRRLLRP
jgi:ribosomal protein S18 acetylase RimI-like enzyme